jgi:broad-specificity NMP kinase
VLRCSPYILWERLEKKKYQREKILENVQSEILDIILNECLEKYGENMLICIDVSNGVDRKLDLVLQLLEKNANLIERVDWLSLIYEKGDLHRFFPT